MKRRLSCLGAVAIGCLVVVVLAAIFGNSPDSSTARPAATDMPKPGQTETTVTPLSGGLGLDLKDWEQKHKATAAADTLGMVQYDNRFLVALTDEKLSRLEINLPQDQALTEAQAEAAGRDLIPSDAELVRTYSPAERPETTVLLFRSKWLAERFAADRFINGNQGEFTVQYNKQAYGVSRLIVALGNNP